jgi:hypothetical protein
MGTKHTSSAISLASGPNVPPVGRVGPESVALSRPCGACVPDPETTHG